MKQPHYPITCTRCGRCSYVRSAGKTLCWQCSVKCRCWACNRIDPRTSGGICPECSDLCGRAERYGHAPRCQAKFPGLEERILKYQALAERELPLC
jgi:hypothetical protein